MKLDAFLADAVAAVPTTAGATSVGNPTDGDSALGILATAIGAYWFFQVQKEFHALLEAAGIVPDADTLTQLRDAINARIDTKIAAIAIPPGVSLANQAEHLQANPPPDKAATPLGVKAVIDRVLDSAPGALDTLNELAAALGDDPNFAATVNAAIAFRARLDGATFTGALRAPKPAAAANDGRVATTSWVRDFFGGAPYRSYTAGGAHQYAWEWGTPNGLLVIKAGDGQRGLNRRPDLDIALANAGWKAAVGAGNTIWFDTGSVAQAYSAATRARELTRDVNHGGFVTAAFSDGTTLWFFNQNNSTALAYVAATGARDMPKDFRPTAAAGATGAASDGSTVWFADEGTAYAYSLATRTADASKNIALPTNTADGAGVGNSWVIWFSDHEADVVYAFLAATRVRAPELEFHGRGGWTGAGIAANTMWFVDPVANRASAFDATVYGGDSSVAVGGQTYRQDGAAGVGDLRIQAVQGLAVGTMLDIAVGGGLADGEVHVVPLF